MSIGATLQHLGAAQEAEHGALLLRAHQAAALCGKSVRTWRTWHASGLIPRPVRIGRSILWRAEELQAWIAAGCPGRAHWEVTYESHAY